MENIYREIAIRFKEFQIKTGLKTETITEKTKWKSTKVLDLRNNRSKITPEIALELKKYFNLNPCWLIFGEGNMLYGDTKPLISFDTRDKRVIGEKSNTKKTVEEEITELREIVESLIKEK